MIESADEFIRLRTSDSADEQHRATHDSAPLAVWLDVLARYPDFKVWVVRNKPIPNEVLDLLARDDSERVRREVASRRKLPRQTFELLAADVSENVRYDIAMNRKCPEDIATMLRQDPSSFVRSAFRNT